MFHHMWLVWRHDWFVAPSPAACLPACLQAWTYHSRAAIVIGVTERNAPVGDRVKLNRLRQLLVRLVERQGDAAVSVEQVRLPALLTYGI
jgi:hypothetical protein